MCSDFSAGVGEDCDASLRSTNFGRLPSPGCLQNQDLFCQTVDPTDDGTGDARCVQQNVPFGGACGATATCAFTGPNNVYMECIEGKCVEYGFVGKCVDGACPGGQICETQQNNCIQRAAKGEACKGGRRDSLNGYDCQYTSETGGVILLCVPDSDDQFLTGPGPGGVGGGFAGLGKCFELIEEGSPCIEGAPFFICSGQNSACINGVCATSVA